jgi:hypothetical protein
MRVLLAISLATLALAGCVGSDSDEEGQNGSNGQGTMAIHGPEFSQSLVFDDVRAGGEPVIAIMPSGTIITSSHPGWTHLHPKDSATIATDLLVPANGQSYLWRSTDNGTTWSHVSLAETDIDNAPRSAALGVSDPEFTILDDGTICMTDLIALASSSVSCSSDDGVTWLPGNSAASGGVNDRQWLASTGNELYFTANYFVDHHIQASNDGGLTWETRGNVPCSQDLVSNPHTDHLIVGCADGIAVSEDAGFTWTRHIANDTFGGPRIMTEPAIDASGMVWMAFQNSERDILISGSPDEGLTWTHNYSVSTHFQDFAGTDEFTGTYVWPWISAGSEGRFAVTWFGSYTDEASDVQSGPWHTFTASFYDAHTGNPTVFVSNFSAGPIHLQPICQDGTTCQVASGTGAPEGDRRLGDFFETTIDSYGYLHGVWSNTANEPDDVVSHVEYAKQTGGTPLLTPEDFGVFMPTQG